MLAFGEQFGYIPKQIGVSQIELAVKHLESALPKQSNVLSVLPINAVAAKMNPYDLQKVNQFENDPQQLMDYVKTNEFHAVLLDEMYAPKANEIMLNFINQYPEHFAHSYESDDGKIDIYLFLYN